MNTERVRVVCPKCDSELLSFFKRDGRVKVTVYGPATSHSLAVERVPVGMPAHRVPFTEDVEDELDGCTDSLHDLECACGVRSNVGLRGYADTTVATLGTRGPRVSTTKAT